MKKLVRINCTENCMIVINGEKGILQNPLDLLCENTPYITFLPQEKNKFLPVTTTLNYPFKQENVEQVPFNTHTEITYSPVEIPDTNRAQIILNKKYLNTYFTLFSENKSFLNIDSANFSHKSTLPKLLNADLKTHNNIVIVTGKTEINSTYIMIYNAKKHEVLLELTADNIEESKTKISAVKFYPTIAGYGVVYEFDYENHKLNTFNVYKNVKPQTTTRTELVPLAFMESIKYKDYTLAKHYLENNLVSNEHLSTYFGNIERIYYNGISSDINYTIKADKYKNYTFKVNDGKIVDIEENLLSWFKIIVIMPFLKYNIILGEYKLKIYLIIGIIVFVLLLILFTSRSRIKKLYERQMQIGNEQYLTGAQVAVFINTKYGLNLSFARTKDDLADAYYPKKKVLIMSDRVCDTPSIASVAIVSHELGHAMQDKEKNWLFVLSNGLNRITRFTNRLIIPLLIIGQLLYAFKYPNATLGLTLIIIAGALFLAHALFKILIIPMEYNASARAIKLIQENNLLTKKEIVKTKKLLNNAGQTYILGLFDGLFIPLNKLKAFFR